MATIGLGGGRNGHVETDRKTSADKAAPTAFGYTPATAARTLKRRSRLQTVVGVILVVVAFVGVLGAILWGTPRTRTVAVAARDLPAGTRLSRADLSTADVQLADAQAALSIAATSLSGLEGQQLAVPVFRNQLLAPQHLGAPAAPTIGPDDVALSIAVRPDTEAAGMVRRGSHVSLHATSNKGKPSSESHELLPHVLVVKVEPDDGQAGGSGLVSGSAGANRSSQPATAVVLAIPRDQVDTILRAKYNDELDLALEPTEATASPAQTSASRGGPVPTATPLPGNR